jgi:hypothetical protein
MLSFILISDLQDDNPLNNYSFKMDSDDFEDANEGVVLDLLMESDIRTAHLAQQLFFQNEFEGARELLDLPAKNMYHFHAITSLSLLEALMTFSPKDFQEALNAGRVTKYFLLRFRISNFFENTARVSNQK